MLTAKIHLVSKKEPLVLSILDFSTSKRLQEGISRDLIRRDLPEPPLRFNVSASIRKYLSKRYE